MDTQLLTESRFREILAWIEKDNCVKPEFADEFIDSLGTAFRRRSRAQRRERGCSGAMLSIGHILESSGIAPEQIPSVKGELESVQEEVVHDNGTGLLNDTGIDSLTLAKAVLHKVRSDRYQVTKSKIILISYVIYGVWLAEKHERVVHEHPQAWKYGPVFLPGLSGTIPPVWAPSLPQRYQLCTLRAGHPGSGAAFRAGGSGVWPWTTGRLKDGFPS